MKVFTLKHVLLIILICSIVNIPIYYIIQFNTNKIFTVSQQRAKLRNELLKSIKNELENNGKVLDSVTKRFEGYKTLAKGNTSYTDSISTIRAIVRDTITQGIDLGGQWSVSRSLTLPTKKYHTENILNIYLFKQNRTCEMYYPSWLDDKPLTPPYLIFTSNLFYGNWATERNILTTKLSTNTPGHFITDTFNLYAVSNNILYSQRKVGKRVIYTVLERLPLGRVDYTQTLHLKQIVRIPKIITPLMLIGKWSVYDNDQLNLSINRTNKWLDFNFQNSGKCTIIVYNKTGKVTSEGKYSLANNLLLIDIFNPSIGIKNPLRFELNYVDSNSFYAFRFVKPNLPNPYLNLGSEYSDSSTIKSLLRERKWYSYFYRDSETINSSNKVNPPDQSLQYNPNGSSISVNPNGSSISVNPNGSSISVVRGDTTNKNPGDTTKKSP